MSQNKKKGMVMRRRMKNGKTRMKKKTRSKQDQTRQ
jgi:hypothetical protein